MGSSGFAHLQVGERWRQQPTAVHRVQVMKIPPGAKPCVWYELHFQLG